MAKIRVPLVTPTESRGDTATKDSIMVNAMLGTEADGKVYAEKRPGLSNLFTYDTLGQGVHKGVFVIEDNALHVLSTVWTWGKYDTYLLGDGTSVDRSAGNPANTLIKYTKMDGYLYNINVIKEDGTLWGWGSNQYGELGDGTFATIAETPVAANTENTFTAVWAGVNVTHALGTDGKLYACGRNSYGEAGVGSEASFILSPTAVRTGISDTEDTDWVYVCNNFTIQRVYAIKQDGTLWRWGLDIGTYATQAGSDSFWALVVGAGNGITHRLSVLKTDGTIHWLFNETTLGLVSLDEFFSVPVATDWADIQMTYNAVSGGYTYYALKTDGTLWVAGDNKYGQCGVGDTLGVNVPAWTQVLAGEVFSQIRVSYTAQSPVCAITTGGALYMWGCNPIVGDSFLDLIGTGVQINPLPVAFGGNGWTFAKAVISFFGITPEYKYPLAEDNEPYKFLEAPGAVGFLLKSKNKLYYYMD